MIPPSDQMGEIRAADRGDLASRTVTRFASLLSSLQLGRITWTGTDAVESRGWSVDSSGSGGRFLRNYTIFEGPSEIQRLVIARAISGVHIRRIRKATHPVSDAGVNSGN